MGVVSVVYAVSMVVWAVRGDRVWSAGRLWDQDVYDDAMKRLDGFRRSGGRLDKDSKKALSDWKHEQARDRWF